MMSGADAAIASCWLAVLEFSRNRAFQLAEHVEKLAQERAAHLQTKVLIPTEAMETAV